MSALLDSDLRERISDDGDDDEVRHVARVRTPVPPPGTRVRALCGRWFRLRDGMITGLPRDVCPLCALRR